MKFAVYGAYELPRLSKIIDPSVEAKYDFWADVGEYMEGLPQACGCYIFAVRNRPWYVGLAEKQSFEKECLTDHKLKHYNTVLDGYKRAAPYLYFIAKLTPAENFASPSVNGHSDIRALEKILIGLALSRNPDILNMRGTKMFREMNVPGIMNTKPGQGSAYAVREIRSLFGI